MNAQHQVHRCSNNMDKTSSAEPAGFIDIDFIDVIAKRITIDCDRDNKIVEDVDDKDAIKDHIVELFRQTLAYKNNILILVMLCTICSKN